MGFSYNYKIQICITKEKRQSFDCLLLVGVAGFDHTLRIARVLPPRFPLRSAQTVTYSKVHRTFSSRSRPRVQICITKKKDSHSTVFYWSGWQDLNPRPTGPKPVALPNCATPRKIWKKQRPPSFNYSDRLKKMVPRSGIEPETRGFSVPCSTY